MRYIQKSISPEDFENWKLLKNADWEPSWGNFQHPQKGKVLESLLKEQGFICCYCGQEIDEKRSHIEHLNPRENDASLALSYDNLIGSCQPDAFIPIQDIHCGHNKSNWYKAELFVTPLIEGCERRFSYTALGKIYPSDENDAAALKTIEVLSLDIGILDSAREKLIEPYLEIDLSNEELELLIKAYSSPREDDTLYPFCFVITNFFSNYLKK